MNVNVVFVNHIYVIKLKLVPASKELVRKLHNVIS